MGWEICRWRWGTPPDYQYRWDVESPAEGAVVIEHHSEEEFTLKQERGTYGHYEIVPCVWECPAADGAEPGVRYHDLTVPDFSNGWDFMRAVAPSQDWDSGDEIVTAKLMGGKIGGVAQNAAQDATEIYVASTPGVLRPSMMDGFVNEGYSLSFGTDTATAASINAGPPSKTNSGTWVNPDQELREYRIKRVGDEVDIGGGLMMVKFTLFTGLAAAVDANADCNLVVKFLYNVWPIVKGDMVDIGGDHLTSGPLPANKILRCGFRNTGATTKKLRGYMKMLYG